MIRFSDPGDFVPLLQAGVPFRTFTGKCLIMHPVNDKNRLYRRGGEMAAARDLYAQHYLRLLVIILIAFLATAVFLYPEKFLLGAYPFSYLGRTHSPHGLQNVSSRIVFNAGMLLCGYTMFLLARSYRHKQPVPESPVYEMLSYISAIGFFLMIVPCDLPRIRFLHAFGSGCVVGGHLFLALIRVVAVQTHLKPLVTFILLVSLLIPVLLYAFLWFFSYPAHPLFQKPAFLAMIGVELYGSRLSHAHGEYPVFHWQRSERLPEQ